jgi:2-C-methyl-D-erythritol 2,4-cyclodiphosphate synthase
VIDSLFGAAAAGDIGTHFPPSDDRYRNVSSRALLRETVQLVASSGYRIINIDATVILQEPKLAPHIAAMRDALSEDIRIPAGAISVKAKSAEKLGAVGRGEAVEAWCVCLIEKIPTGEG